MKQTFKIILPALGAFFTVILLTSIMDVDQFRDLKTWFWTFDYRFTFFGITKYVDAFHSTKDILLGFIAWKFLPKNKLDKMGLWTYWILILIIAVILHEYILHGIF